MGPLGFISAAGLRAYLAAARAEGRVPPETVPALMKMIQARITRRLAI